MRSKHYYIKCNKVIEHDYLTKVQLVLLVFLVINYLGILKIGFTFGSHHANHCIGVRVP